MSRNSQKSRLSLAALAVLGAATGLALSASDATSAEGKNVPIAERKFIFEPWEPKDIDKRRKEYGLIGPGPQSAYPEPRFPRNLAKPTSIEQIMPNARATVRQTGGRSPLGLAEPGDRVLIVVEHTAVPMVQDAIVRAYKERGIDAKVLYEHELLGVDKKDLEAIDSAENVFDATDAQQEFAHWFFRAIYDKDKAKAWFKEQDAALHDVMFPDIKYPEPRLKELSKNIEKLVAGAMIKYMDEHAEINKVYWRTGGRTRTRTNLKQHGEKFIGNYTYLNFFDLMSNVPSYPGDVWRLVETKMIEPIAFVDRAEVSDPEGLVLSFDLDEKIADSWAKGVYQQGHLYMLPPQATGRWPYSLVEYPSYESSYLPAIHLLSLNGIVAGTNDHVSTHPRLEVHIKGGKISDVKGGGYYGELMKLAQTYPGIQTETFPEYDHPGYWWAYEAGTGTNPKYFKHPAELLAGGNSSERNIAGTIHWSFGSYAQHGPEKIGELSPKRIAFGERTNLPIDHCCHNHTLMPTYQVRIRGLDQWVTLIEHGQVVALKDRYARALASRYGNPDKILAYDYTPPLPGINAPGSYNDYARNPGGYWIKWSESVLDGTNPYLKD